jgi:hypothetical protein
LVKSAAQGTRRERRGAGTCATTKDGKDGAENKKAELRNQLGLF